MADDFDVEAMLEAPYRSVAPTKDDSAGSGGAVEEKEDSKKGEKNGRGSRSRSRSPGRRKRSRSRERKRRSRSRDRGDRVRSRSRRSPERARRSPERRRSPDRRRRSRSKERRRSRSKDRSNKERGGDREERNRRRSRSRDRKRRSRSRDRKKSASPKKDDDPEPTPESRDSRTVFVMQLSQRVRARDLEDFFSSVGKVRDVKMISDRNSRRSKGVGYVEFQSDTSVPLALGLNNQKLKGIPIIVQPSQAEKNRAAQTNQTLQKGSTGPMRLYVGSLHYNITEEMLRGIFEPFGKVGGIDNIQLMMDSETQRSKGYGFITFHDSEDAKRALDQLNGFELAGRPMKVNHVTERNENNQVSSVMDNDELERTGIELSATDRIQLMVKLAEGKDFRIPSGAMDAINPLGAVPGVSSMQTMPSLVGVAAAAPLNLQASLAAAQAQAHQAAAMAAQAVGVSAPATNTSCFMLSNMFDPATETNPSWDLEIREDVIEECNKHGGALHIHVDKTSPQGNVYVKCPNAQIALAAVTSLHGRWFAGKMITAAYVPIANYHAIFPQAAATATLLQSSTGR